MFNVGVELGQLLFIAAVLTLGHLLGRMAIRSGPRLEAAAAYGIGAVAAFWTIERVASFWT
jgi:hypothetical protein